MTTQTQQTQQTDSHETRKSGSTGAVSRWMQHRMNARMNKKIRRGRDTFMGMDVLILHTVGRRSGQPRQSPLAWFADGADARLVIASGGGEHHPDWYRNLMAHPEQASIELPGREATPVALEELAGTEREAAWQRIAAAQPRLAKYQGKTERVYPIVRLAAR
jgi:deazaflavin-dependent oxidoreductase (nitroreductase family)